MFHSISKTIKNDCRSIAVEAARNEVEGHVINIGIDNITKYEMRKIAKRAVEEAFEAFRSKLKELL